MSYIFQPLRKEPAEIGLLVNEVDPSDVYLAMPTGAGAGKHLGLIVHTSILEERTDRDGRRFDAVAWTEDFDDEWRALIDLMIDLRCAHPRLMQMTFFDPEREAA